jgi:hypothetical protein
VQMLFAKVDVFQRVGTFGATAGFTRGISRENRWGSQGKSDAQYDASGRKFIQFHVYALK